MVGAVVCVSLAQGEICAEFLSVFPLLDKAAWGGHPVCWRRSLHFCFVCCLDEVSCTRRYWWLGDPGWCIQVVSFVCVLTTWYPPGWVLWWSRLWESVPHSTRSGLDLCQSPLLPPTLCCGFCLCVPGEDGHQLQRLVWGKAIFLSLNCCIRLLYPPRIPDSATLTSDSSFEPTVDFWDD